MLKKSVAQLKKDAKSGKLEAMMVIKLGEKVDQNDLPKVARGWRRIVNSNTKNIMFQTGNRISYLEIPKASLVEYTDNDLKIYYAGYREPNESEKRILKEWNEIASTEGYKKELEDDLYTDGSTTFYREQWFFQRHNAEYLMGLHYQRGMKLDFCRRANGDKNFIYDEKIKGEICMEYKIRTVE